MLGQAKKVGAIARKTPPRRGAGKKRRLEGRSPQILPSSIDETIPRVGSRHELTSCVERAGKLAGGVAVMLRSHRGSEVEVKGAKDRGASI